jgi:hypothetical protein
MTTRSLNLSSPTDLATIITYGRNCRLQKESIRNGENTRVTPGEIFEGKIKNLKLGTPVVIRGARNLTSSSLQRVTIDNSPEDIRFHTKTSVYKIIDMDNENTNHCTSLLYLQKGSLGLDQEIPDGFYDGGPQTTFQIDEDGHLSIKAPQEIIFLDQQVDEELRRKTQQSISLLKDIKDPRAKAKILAMYVSSALGGHQYAQRPEISIIRLTRHEITQILKKSDDDYLPLGQLNHGTSYHRALLFKYLADRNNIYSTITKSRTKAQPDNQHAWNIVMIDEKFYFVDLIHSPGSLYEDYSPKAGAYKNACHTTLNHLHNFVE